MNGWSPADLLPGLWVALLGLGLAAALRRWFDPVPGRILAAFGLAIAILFGPALFGGRVLISVDNLRVMDPYRQLEPSDTPGLWIHGDLVFLISPWLHQVEETLADGRWPLWNDLAGAGMPMMGDPQMQSFQPLVLAAYPFSTWTGIGVTAALRVLVALIFAFLLMRRLGLGEVASAAGSLAFGVGGFLIFWLNWPMANAAALLPLALYAVVRCDEERGRRDYFLLGLATASLFLGGHPETFVYALIVTGLFALARCRSCWRTEGGAAAVRLLVRYGVTFLLAGLTVAPVLLTVQEYLPKTRRAAVVDYTFSHPSASPKELWSAEQRSETLETWRRWVVLRSIPFFAHRAFGTHNTDWWGETNIVEDGASFVGTATLLAALIGLAPLRRRLRFPQEGFFAAIFVGGVALVLQPPGLQALVGQIPILGPTAAHRHHRFLLAIALAIAYLAACQIERWQRGERRWGLAVAVGLGLAGLIAWGYLAHPYPKNPQYLAGMRQGWMIAQLAVLGLTVALLAWGRPPSEGAPRWRRWSLWALPLLIGGELLIAHQPANPTNPRRLAYPVTPPVRFLQENAGDTRIIGIGPAFRASLPAVYGLNDLRIDNPSAPEAHIYLTRPLLLESAVPSFARPLHPLYDLLGVRYVMVRPGRSLRMRQVFEHESGWIYERPNALSRLFLPPRALIAQRGDDWLAWVAQNADFSRRALVIPSPGRNRRWRAERPRAASLEVSLPEPAHVRGQVTLTEPRLLASSVLQDGHWRLLVDGEPHPTVLANGPLVAAWLPAEARQVDLIYRPLPFIAGCLLAALALTVAAALCVPPPRGSRVLSSQP